MSNKLYIVSTPIGNLKDITLRAIETLKNVDVIACEDTRVTIKLLNHFEINSKQLIAYHDKNEKNSTQGIIKMLNEGKNVAIVSDAGTPLISDPGFLIVRECKKLGIPIEIIPGVSAHLIAIQLASFDMNYTFLGFLSPKTGTRKNQIKKLIPGTYVTHVSPYKLEQTLLDIESILGKDTRVSLSKELTKMHEQVFDGSVNHVYQIIKNNIKGEYTLVFEVQSGKKL